MLIVNTSLNNIEAAGDRGRRKLCHFGVDVIKVLTLGGVLAVYLTGRSDVFFWVENLHRRFFLGQVICYVFLGLKVCLIK